MIHSRAHPPKSRLAKSLAVPLVHVAHAEGVAEFDANGIVEHILARTEAFLALSPVPGFRSGLSGRPALLYRSDDLEIPLAPDEIAALVGVELRPAEYVRLRSLYGIFFEIHDDFYDEDTGAALQPKGILEHVRGFAGEPDTAVPSPR